MVAGQPGGQDTGGVSHAQLRGQMSDTFSYISQILIYLLNRDIRFVTEVGQIGTILYKSGTFEDPFSVYFCSAKMIWIQRRSDLSHIVTIRPTLGPNLTHLILDKKKTLY